MLPGATAEPFDSPSHIFEVIWDGIRAVMFVERGAVRIQDAYARDITARYPELHGAASDVRGSGVVLDGVIVCPDDNGRPDFGRLHRRLSVRDDLDSALLAAELPVTFQCFDILHRNSHSVISEPLRRRKDILQQAVRVRGALDVPDFVEREGIAFFEAARSHGLPGIIAKDRSSAYVPGARDPAWVAMRVYARDKFVVAGYTYGHPPIPAAGPRRAAVPFGSLLLGQYDSEGTLRFAGEVEGPFAPEAVPAMVQAFDAVASPDPPFADPPSLGRLIFWCRPELAADVRFAGRSAGGRLRFPIFEYLRPDIPVSACRLPQDPAP